MFLMTGDSPPVNNLAKLIPTLKIQRMRGDRDKSTNSYYLTAVDVKEKL